MPLVRVHGVRLLVQEAGSGEPLVLVHGSWGDRRVWAFVEDDLARSFRVVSYDRRGHSDSEDGPGPGSRRDDEDDLAALIERLGLAPAHLAGNSFGASIALGLAARRPELVRSLCGHEPPLIALAADDPAVRALGDGVGAVVALIDRGEEEAAARLFAEQVAGRGAWELTPPDDRVRMIANAGTLADEQRDPGWATIDLDALAALARPVLLTHGDQSPPFFAAIISRLASAVEHAEVRTLTGAGHEPHMTHPAEWVAVVKEFAGRAAGA
jgi:pimeloyl-ACP methyl ester carboxylesterase